MRPFACLLACLAASSALAQEPPAPAPDEATAVAHEAAMPAVATGARPVLGVLKFQDETGALFMQGGIGRVLTNMLTNEISNRPAFTVVERQKLRAVLEEQDLSQSGRVSPETSIQIGKLTGAQYLVTGTVTSFEEKVEMATKRGFLGGTKVTGVSQGGYLAVDLRVIDTTTGQIAYSRTVEGMTAAEPGEARNVDPMTQGPDQRAVRAAVIEIVDYLQCAMVVRDACLGEFAAKDAARQERTRDSIRIK